MPLAVRRDGSRLRLGSVPFRRVPTLRPRPTGSCGSASSPHRSCSASTNSLRCSRSGTSTWRRSSLTCSTPRHTRSCTPSARSKSSRASSSPSAEHREGHHEYRVRALGWRKSRRRASRHARRPPTIEGSAPICSSEHRSVRSTPRTWERTVSTTSSSIDSLTPGSGCDGLTCSRSMSASDQPPPKAAHRSATTVAARHRHAPAPTRRARRPSQVAASASWAITTPACHPGARPPAGGLIVERSMPPRVRAQDTTELEFHISPVLDSSRPQTGVGISVSTSSTRRAHTSDVDTQTGLPTAARMSGI